LARLHACSAREAFELVFAFINDRDFFGRQDGVAHFGDLGELGVEISKVFADCWFVRGRNLLLQEHFHVDV